MEEALRALQFFSREEDYIPHRHVHLLLHRDSSICLGSGSHPSFMGHHVHPYNHFNPQRHSQSEVPMQLLYPSSSALVQFRDHQICSAYIAGHFI